MTPYSSPTTPVVEAAPPEVRASIPASRRWQNRKRLVLYYTHESTDLDYATLQLAYTTLQAPVAGMVARKRLEVGQVVQAGRPVLAIVPLEHVWVEANFKET